jgi:hypothetical protein
VTWYPFLFQFEYIWESCWCNLEHKRVIIVETSQLLMPYSTFSIQTSWFWWRSFMLDTILLQKVQRTSLSLTRQLALCDMPTCYKSQKMSHLECMLYDLGQCPISFWGTTMGGSSPRLANWVLDWDIFCKHVFVIPFSLAIWNWAKHSTTYFGRLSFHCGKFHLKPHLCLDDQWTNGKKGLYEVISMMKMHFYMYLSSTIVES